MFVPLWKQWFWPIPKRLNSWVLTTKVQHWLKNNLKHNQDFFKNLKTKDWISPTHDYDYTQQSCDFTDVAGEFQQDPGPLIAQIMILLAFYHYNSSHLVDRLVRPAISGLTLLIPYITGVRAHLWSGMQQQVSFMCIYI